MPFPLRPVAAAALVAALAPLPALAATRVAAQASMPVALTPAPAHMTPEKGALTLGEGQAVWIAPGDAEARLAADWLVDTLARTRGVRLVVREGQAPARGGGVALSRGGPAGEAYDLDVSPHRAEVRARDKAGLFYGAVSLWQLSAQARPGAPLRIQAVKVQDAPRFAWRGLMLDSARHYQSPEAIKRVIDGMASLKLNTLHWHLTDDQGWRLEIKKYPRLTEQGAWRQPAGAAGRTASGEPVRYGGFYTQDQAREIVAYAAARSITVVPEVEMPGHALAAIVSYPQLGTRPPPPGVGADWGVYPDIFNVDDSTFAFLEDVLDEVMGIFPSTYIHVGGDEALKAQWEASPKIQARMKELGLADEHALQSYFVQRIEKHLNAKGRRLVGWDEILEGGLAPDATVMSWRGLDGAVAAAKQGHDTILAPGPVLYFDHRQSASPDEPPGRGKMSTLRSVYAFNAEPSELTPEERKHVLGVQATMFSEHIRTDERAMAMLFPRLAALAENAWTPSEGRSWDGFAARLPATLGRMSDLGLGYDSVPFEPQAAFDPPAAGQVTTRLDTGLQVGEVRYTLDGAEPTAASRRYQAPLSVKTGATLKARTFLGDQPLGRAQAWTVTAERAMTRRSHELNRCTEGLILNLEDDAPGPDGKRGTFMLDILNPCWIWKDVDLGTGARLSVTVGQLPFNFQLGNKLEPLPVRPPSRPEGELEVRFGCKGPRLATVPLTQAAANPGRTTLEVDVPSRGKGDLCFTFSSLAIDPIWALYGVTITPAAALPAKAD
ncbi:MAG: family 20 glycosylhydrolase [Caulobacter sp.]|nr:family 20 glycosylhydrolase [Caulobacter sp.]